MRVDFFNAIAQDAPFKEEIRAAVSRVLDSGRFVDGDETNKLEERLAKLNGVKYCALMSNGTSALETLLRCFDLDKGKNILTPTNSFIATSSAISTVGSNPIFVDSDATCNIDLNLVEKELKNGNIQGVLVVNLYGNPVEHEKLYELCIKYGVICLLDLAQSHGTKYKENHPAQYCHGCAFSFYVTKVLGAYSESGCLLSNSKDVIDKAKSLRNHGRSTENYSHQYLSSNLRGSEFSASVLNVKLNHLDYYYGERIKTTQEYNNYFSDYPEILLKTTPNSEIVRYVYNIFVPQRDKLIEYLNKEDIGTNIHYPIIISEQKAYKHLRYVKENFPVAHKQSQETLSLPFWSGFPSKYAQIVSKKVIEFFKSN
ncbi:MAG: DegT/DnrJ/EryC1/StrS family aminotransferase [Sulfurimonas sp.]|jgi:dTDP-4-amino-4,6-dideoxygalactose transaminase